MENKNSQGRLVATMNESKRSSMIGVLRNSDIRITSNGIVWLVIFSMLFFSIKNNPYHIGKWFYEFNQGLNGVNQNGR